MIGLFIIITGIGGLIWILGIMASGPLTKKPPHRDEEP